jgi:membrane protein YdbS with pleckstrin-like domain
MSSTPRDQPKAPDTDPAAGFTRPAIPRPDNPPETAEPSVAKGWLRVTDPDETQEVDLWWGGYAGRAMTPSFVLCALLTAAIAGGAWYLWEAHGLPAHLVRYAAYGLAGTLWSLQLVRWGYRVAMFNYRLTTRRLFQDCGPLSPVGAVELSRVAGVRVERGPLDRLLGVGRLRIVTENGTPSAVTLEGVRHPEHAARQMQRAVQRARSVRGVPGTGPPTW